MSQDLSDRPKTSFGQKIFLALFGIFLCLVLLELGLRLGGSVYSAMNPLPKDRGAQFRILCIGESTTFGIGASDRVRLGYPHQLELMLRERFPRMRIQVFLDGRIGGNTTENLIRLPSLIKKYRPHLVIFMVGINNWWNLDKSNVLIFNKNKGLSEFILKAAVFMDRFRVYKLFKSIACNTGLLKLNMPMPEEARYKKDVSALDTKEARQNLKIIIDYHKKVFNICDQETFNKVAFYDLREMVRMCRKRKIKVMICGYPRSGNELYDAQKKIALLFNSPFVDNRAVFKDLADPDSYFSSDRVHPNDKGYHLLAENIFKCVLENSIIETGVAR